MPSVHHNPPPTDTVRVAISGTIFGEPYTNVMWLAVTTDGTRTINDLDALIGSVLGYYNTDLVALLATNVAGGTAAAEWITGVGTQLAVTKTVVFAPSGTAAVNDCAAAYLVNWTISDRYRGGKPRTYLPGVQTGHVVNGRTIDGTALASLNTGITAFKNHVDALTETHILTVQLGTVRFQQANAALAPPVFRAYTGGHCNTLMGTQRRRIGR